MTQILLLVTLLVASGFATAGHVYFEYGLGKVTAGYDLQRNETEIRKFYLAAEGPGDLQEEAYRFCRNCVEESLTLAATAAYHTPGDASVRLAAAIPVWNTSFSKCMSGKAFAKALIKQFRIGITNAGNGSTASCSPIPVVSLMQSYTTLTTKNSINTSPGGDGENLIESLRNSKRSSRQRRSWTSM